MRKLYKFISEKQGNRYRSTPILHICKEAVYPFQVCVFCMPAIFLDILRFPVNKQAYLKESKRKEILVNLTIKILEDENFFNDVDCECGNTVI